MPTTTDPATPAEPGIALGAGSVLRRVAILFGPAGRQLASHRWFPLWAILRHTGRRSGTRYAIAIVALPSDGGFLIPLPFGERTQWIRNLEAAGGGGLRWRGREYRIADPVVLELGAVAARLPRLVRAAARTFGIGQFVQVTATRSPSTRWG